MGVDFWCGSQGVHMSVCRDAHRRWTRGEIYSRNAFIRHVRGIELWNTQSCGSLIINTYSYIIFYMSFVLFYTTRFSSFERESRLQAVGVGISQFKCLFDSKPLFFFFLKVISLSPFIPQQIHMQAESVGWSR